MSLFEFFPCSTQHAFWKSWRILRGCATLRIRLQFSNCGSEQELLKKFNENTIWYKFISLLKFTEFTKFLTILNLRWRTCEDSVWCKQEPGLKGTPKIQDTLQGSGEQRPRPLPRPDAVLPLNRLILIQSWSLYLSLN
jgi:hypothetical protein